MNETLIIEDFEFMRKECKKLGADYTKTDILMLMFCSRLDRISLDLHNQSIKIQDKNPLDTGYN